MDVSDAGEDLTKMHTWEKWGVVTGSEWEMGQGRIRHSTPGQTCHSLRSQSKPFPLCRPLLAAGTPPFSSHHHVSSAVALGFCNSLSCSPPPTSATASSSPWRASGSLNLLPIRYIQTKISSKELHPWYHGRRGGFQVSSKIQGIKEKGQGDRVGEYSCPSHIWWERHFRFPILKSCAHLVLHPCIDMCGGYRRIMTSCT